MQTIPSDQTVLTIPEAAEACGVTRMTMWRWVTSNRIKYAKTLGGHYRIRRSALNEFIGRTNGARHRSEVPFKPRILVVDDDKSIQKYLDRGLTGKGYDVRTCSDGFEAGLWVMKFQPQLLILDLFMPALDGFQVCRTLQSDPDTTRIHILAVSGYPSQANIRKAYEAGADAFLAKPLDMQELLNQIDSMLSSGKQRQAALIEG